VGTPGGEVLLEGGTVMWWRQRGCFVMGRGMWLQWMMIRDGGDDAVALELLVVMVF